MNHPATSRSVIQRNHALITPESHVSSPLPGWTQTQGVSLIGPPLGAGFAQYFAFCEAGASAAPAPSGAARFLYLVEGSIEVAAPDTPVTLTGGGFVYFPPGDTTGWHVEAESRLLVIEKPYVALEGVAPPELVTGQEQQIAASPFWAIRTAQLKKLLPEEVGFDFEINIFAFSPGASLPLVEVHIMEHGLLLLDGQGIYRLDDRWYPVEAGDVIWMGPFCPQWFVAIGKTAARYLYYKDMNRAYLGDCA